VTFASVLDLAKAEWEGRTVSVEYGKSITQTTTAGTWFDITGSAGTPKSKQWFDAAPLVAQQIVQNAESGLFHGSGVAGSGRQKVLRSWRSWNGLLSALPMTAILCDYLLYYPSIEDAETGIQAMDNSLTLPRYTTGEGVEMMAVTISSRTGGQTFTVNYTNSNGVAGRVSQTVTQNAVAAPGTITTSSTNTASSGNPFIGLQEGDTGVRSVESVQMNGPDTGFFALVLVKPLAVSTLIVRNTVYEKDLLLHATEMPIIYDGAYLSQILMAQANLSASALRGNFKFVWN
jgi:hypothetical protein